MAAQSDTTTPSTRRGLLGALLAVPVVAAAPALAAKAPSIETPDLLAAGERLTALGNELVAAIAQRDEAFATYERTRPALPDELIVLKRDELGAMGEPREVGGGQTRQVYTSRRVRADVILRDLSRHTKEGKRLRRLARVAKAYEDAEATAYEAAACSDREQAASAAGNSYLGLLAKMLDHSPTTLQGLAFFAEALPLIDVAAAAQGYGSMLRTERLVSNKLAGVVIKLAREATHG